ncbi:helix-turn-helix domain-containing protein [Psychrobacter frigidicola]|uniref:helix-turn-helix domain-containing protein n=1 Tax=Psychrobacter frigidicola TaxID=45611 RepID=UPI001D125406|nr:helix-turn-helix domain-containing protein [Psychrobacter frigidicola]
MTYSADFRAQVIKSVKNKDMSIRQACTFYNVSKTALQRWLKNPSIKQTRDKSPTKIPNEALLKNEEDQLEKIINDFNERWFKNWGLTPEEQRVKFISLAKRLTERADFKHKYVDTNDAQHKKLEFESMVKEIVVAGRRKELDFYKQFIQDESFQAAFIHSLRHVVGSGLVESN